MRRLTLSLLLLLSASFAHAQDENIVIRGTAIDYEGFPFPGVVIEEKIIDLMELLPTLMVILN